MRRRGSGFTLIEMLTVIGIIMLVMAIALPNLMGMLEQRRWTAAISAFENVMRRCRIFAINDKRDYSIEFCTSPDNEMQYFRIEIESPLLERIPELNSYFSTQCDYYPNRLPVDWRLAFEAGDGTISGYYSWKRSPDAVFSYDGPKWDIDARPWGMDERVKDNLLVDKSNVLPHGITVDFDASAGIVNFDAKATSLNQVPWYGYDLTKDLRFDARGVLVQTQNPEIVLSNKEGQNVRLQALRSTGRVRRVIE